MHDFLGFSSGVTNDLQQVDRYNEMHSKVAACVLLTFILLLLVFTQLLPLDTATATALHYHQNLDF